MLDDNELLDTYIYNNLINIILYENFCDLSELFNIENKTNKEIIEAWIIENIL